MPLPKKRTYEQLERALTRANQKSVRTKRAYDSYLRGEAERAKGWRREGAAREDRALDRVAEAEDKNDELEAKLEAETFRADNLLSETDELNDLIRADHERAQEGRAATAELNLIHLRKALVSSNAVSLGLLDMLKRATAPVVMIKNPKGPSLAGYATESTDGEPG